MIEPSDNPRNQFATTAIGYAIAHELATTYDSDILAKLEKGMPQEQAARMVGQVALAAVNRIMGIIPNDGDLA